VVRESVRDVLRLLEPADPEEQRTMLCFLAGRHVELDRAEVNGTLRRAALLLASGGNPRRRLELYGRAVTAIAQDVDTPERRRQLETGLAALESEATDVRGVTEALRHLQGDPDLAWQCFAAALLAEELGSDPS
jgi:hypothetical protein